MKTSQNESGNILQHQQEQDLFKLTREAVVISLPLAPFTEGVHVSRPLGEQEPARRFGKHSRDPEDKQTHL